MGSSLDELAKTVREATRDVPASHGWPHLRKTAEIAYYIALKSNLDPFFPAAAALIHDLKWWDEKERRVRRITVAENLRATIGAEEALTRAGIDPADQKTILEIAANHRSASTFSERVVADADRVSRMGVEGLLSIFYANHSYGVPFYIEGSPILWDSSMPLVPFKEIKSCVDDVRSCRSWWKILQTSVGITLFHVASRVNDRFLQLFAENPKDSYGTWIPRLEKIRRAQQDERERLCIDMMRRMGVLSYAEAVARLESPDLLG